MYRVLGAAFIAGLISLALTPGLITILKRRKYGQAIREDGPKVHFAKEGTPTMGGILIILGTVVAYLIMSAKTPEGLIVIGTMAACGLIGFADDMIKVMHKRSLGLKPSVKLVFQLVIAIGFAFAATTLHSPGYPAVPPEFSFVGNSFVNLSWFFFIWVLIIIIGETNGVNLTDGLDGLATGSMIIVMAAYLLIAFTMFRHPVTQHPAFYEFTGPPALDVAIICGAVMGACIGFLWWNAAPAAIFMGDTGSLALGGVLAAVAIMTRTQFLVLLLGGIFFIESLSVMIQIGVFKLTGGKRVFKMAPIHHHFELIGWSEFTVIIRLWIISGMCVLLGFGIFYINFVSRVPK
ncbi:MAG: phospho-N-acetylmuramoyl-pentapeptide-transferase [Actinobacteria bacterium]|nr:phospho-N-acetylmuramoyl-pentapeptide-transferase [Actinomycetota bacterium]